MVAYDVALNLFGTTGIPLRPSRILRAMKMANRVMSDHVLKIWIDKFRPYLSCNSEDSESCESVEAYLAPHEFLVLLSHGQDSMRVIDSTLRNIVGNGLCFKQMSNGLKVAAIRSGNKFVRDEVRSVLNSEPAVKRVDLVLLLSG